MLFKKYIPKKRLGQIFLQDQKVIDYIINFINPKNTELLIEIGPGLAALTKPVCELVDRLIVIELDKELLYFLKKFDFFKKLIVFNQDVMNFDFKNIYINNRKLLRIFGNIPYNISVKLILYFIHFCKYILDINIMIQKEVADRLIASPGNRCYGRLSIIFQCYYDIFIGCNILPNSFFPIPKVDSSFVKIIPKNFPLYSFKNIHILSAITCLAFQKRRKILKNSLSSILSVQDLLNLNIDPNVRAENISVLEYCKISEFVRLLKRVI